MLSKYYKNIIPHTQFDTLGKHATKRDLYYTNVELFQTQAYLDAIIDDLAFKFGVSRHSLHIVR